jgi:hypothetical protein
LQESIFSFKSFSNFVQFEFWAGVFLACSFHPAQFLCPRPHPTMLAPPAYGYFVLLAVCSAICSAKFGFFCQAEHMNG